jgi:hypothetical protein
MSAIRVSTLRRCSCVSGHLASIDRIACSIVSSPDLPRELAGKCRLHDTRQSREADSYRFPLSRHGFCGGEELVCGALPGEDAAAGGFDEAAVFSLKSVA